MGNLGGNGGLHLPNSPSHPPNARHRGGYVGGGGGRGGGWKVKRGDGGGGGGRKGGRKSKGKGYN